MELTNEEGFVLPDVGRPATHWGELERATVAAAYLTTAMHASSLAVLRDLGSQRLVERDVWLVRAQQAGHFVEGCRRLGITDEPDAVTSAKYHALSNALGGLRMRYAIESAEKAWIFYLPSPLRPDAAIETVDHAIADFANWHARNGELLQNPGLVFVVTHAYARGDYYNAGYWLDTGRAVDPEDRCRFSWGERVPDEFQRPEFDPVIWPEARRAKILQRYWLSWLRGSARASAEVLQGPGVDCFQHGMTVATYAWLDRLLGAFAGEVEESPATRAARLVAGLHAICGLQAEMAMQGDGVRLELDELVSGTVSVGAGRTCELGEALMEAWAGPCRQVGAALSRDARGAKAVWRFTSVDH